MSNETLDFFLNNRNVDEAVNAAMPMPRTIVDGVIVTILSIVPLNFNEIILSSCELTKNVI